MNSEYIRMAEIRNQLPVFKYKEDILKTIAQERVLIIRGETGSGKLFL